ncbi:MAG: MerR family transcriptional regulator [Gemmatimonadales bacterium]
MDPMRIGALAERTGTNAPTIRYYEEIGLLRRPDRQPGGQRIYGEEDAKRLTFIRRCRDFGFPIEQVRSLVALLDDRTRSCMEARDLAGEHLGAVQAKIQDLRALERSLASFLASCDTSCAGGPAPDCVVLADLCGQSALGSRSP